MTSDELVGKYNALASQNSGPQRQPWQALFDQPAKQKGKGGFLTSLISELGGGVGAAGGAAIGTALLPGVGTLAGAILGGLTGGTAGRGVENKVRDDQNFFGAGGSAKTALGEGIMSGALSGLGEGYQVFKGAKAAGIGAKEALTGGLKGAEKVGIAKGIGEGLERGAGGYGIGAKVSGERALTASASDEIAGTLKKLGIKAAAPETQAKLIDKKIAEYGAKLSDKYTKNAVAFTAKEADELGQKVLSRVVSQPGLDEATKKYALDEVTNLVKNHGMDTSTLWNYTKELEKNGINFAANPDAATAGRQVVNKIISGDVRDELAFRIGGLKETNKLYSSAIKAQDYLLKAAADRTGGGLTGKLMNTALFKGTEAKLGSGLAKGGNFAAGGGGVLSSIANQGIRQLPGNIVGAISGMTAPPDPTATAGVADAVAGGLADPSAQANPQLDSLSQAIDAAMQQDLATTGGKNLANLQKYYDFASKRLQATSGGAPNITKVTAQQYGLAQSGASALQQLGQMISSNPGVINKTATPGRGLPGIGGFISNAAGTGEYDAIGYNIADSLLRLRTGAQANESEVKKLQTQIMPRAGDSPETIQTKLAQINQIFSSVLQTAGGSGGSSLEDALMQYQGAQ